MEEYVKSKPMLASGILGATTTMVTGTLVTQFGLPGNWTALGVSFLLGLLVLTDQSIPRFQQIVLYFINSMIIFTTAMGINSAGVAATKSPEQHHYEQRWVPPSEENRFFRDWFASSSPGKQGAVDTPKRA
jgi:hypothetical protein